MASKGPASIIPIILDAAESQNHHGWRCSKSTLGEWKERALPTLNGWELYPQSKKESNRQTNCQNKHTNMVWSSTIYKHPSNKIESSSKFLEIPRTRQPTLAVSGQPLLSSIFKPHPFYRTDLGYINESHSILSIPSDHLRQWKKPLKRRNWNSA